MDMEDDTGQRSQHQPKFGFRIYENFRNIVKKSSRSSNYDLSEVTNSPTYEDVEVTSSHALSSLETNDSLNVIKNDGNATDDSGIDSIEQNNSSSSPEPLLLRFKDSHFKKDAWKREFVLHRTAAEPAELTSVKKKVENLEHLDQEQEQHQQLGLQIHPLTTTPSSSSSSSIGVNPAKPPIYSSVLKKRSNPARDFALTVLENDKKNVKINSINSKDIIPAQQQTCSADLNEISQLLSSTNQLLSRNSHLRASLTISVKRSNSKKATTTTFIIPNPNKGERGGAGHKKEPDNKQFEYVDIALDDHNSDDSSADSSDVDRKNSTSEDSGRHSDSSRKSDGDSSDKCCDSSQEEEEAPESTLPSLEPINPFTRYNPARRPINPNHTMEVRRSIRLPPKTVASLASKFDNLLTNEPKKKEKELPISKKLGIAQIIGTLEKLDEKAKHETFILQKNKIKAAQQEAADAQKKEDIDKLMKSTKSALEEVELPSSTSTCPQADDEEDWVEDSSHLVEDSDQSSSSPASSCTDKYLQTLQRIAKDNATTGQFKTSLPKDQNALPILASTALVKTIVKVPPSSSQSNNHQDKVAENKKDEVVVISSHSTSTIIANDADYDVFPAKEDDDSSDKKSTITDPVADSDQGSYDPIDYIVKAEPAIVTEDQLDSLSVYDDAACGVSLGGDLYESIAGSIMNLAKKNTSMEDMYSSMLYKDKKSSNQEHLGHRGSIRSSSIYSETGVTSDEWIDLEETDTETYYDAQEDKNPFIRASNVRNSHRASITARKRWQNRSSNRHIPNSSRRNWAQMAAAANSPHSRKDVKDGDEELYESIYEVIQPQSSFESESDFDEIADDIPSNDHKLKSGDTKLTKLAEAANKKMKKLRRNWSLKKSDISKSWSRIRKYSSPSMMTPIRPAFPITITQTNTLRRKPSRRSTSTTGSSGIGQVTIPDTKSVVRHHGGPVVGDGSNNDTTFYITLTIEQDDDDDDPLERIDSADKSLKKKSWRSKRRVGGGSTSTSASSTGASSSSHAEPDSRSATISMSGSSVISGVTSKSSPDTSLTSGIGTSEHSQSTTPARPPKLRRPSMLTRPTEAPPAPPARKPITFMLGPRSDHSDSPICDSPEVLAQETYMSSFFQTEPLYQQFYTNQIHKLETSSVEDMYESVEHPDSIESGQDLEEEEEVIEHIHYSRPSAMDLTSACHGGRRSMWSELPEVMSSGILDNITSEAKKLHEAMFEVITSEASYLKSLNVLLKHFAQSPRLSGLDDLSVISKWDHKRLFGDVINVRQCSERFLEDLEKKWQSSILLDGLCEVVRDHAKNHFQVYVKYCSNQVDQGKLLKELSENPRFVEAVRELEASPVCQSLKMQSFLMLPMQRITRLPLLIDAIFTRLDSNSSEFEVCREALEIINKVVHECNDSALIEGRRKEMLLLEQQLKFRENVKLFPLCSASRWLVKRGDVTRIYWKENAEAKLTFGRKVSKQTYNFLLFNDLLVVAKKKSDGTFLVVDYCPRNLVQMSSLLQDETHEKLPYGMSHAKNIDLDQIVLFTMLQNHEHKTIEWLLIFATENERSHWIELVTPPSTSPENPEEKIYEDWDCPLVEAVASVEAENSNEVPLQKGDKANVLRKLSDSGWYYVERLADGQKGWVPISATREIESNHIRARNFKQRHAFLKLLTSMSATENNGHDLLNNNNNQTNKYHVTFED